MLNNATATPQGFNALNLIDPLCRAVHAQGYTVPTPIQNQAIPHLLEGRDLLGCAQTGTGKTAAFALPILQRLASNKNHPGPRGVRALILAPTRELAVQIGDSFYEYGRYLKTSQALVFGGVKPSPQIKALSRGVDILVATPGRLLDLMNQGFIKLDNIEVLVLDEADRMLDMGFLPDIRKICGKVPAKRQTMLFSATFPDEVMHLTEQFLSSPVTVTVTPPQVMVEKIDQRIHFVDRENKAALPVPGEGLFVEHGQRVVPRIGAEPNTHIARGGGGCATRSGDIATADKGDDHAAQERNQSRSTRQHEVGDGEKTEHEADERSARISQVERPKRRRQRDARDQQGGDGRAATASHQAGRLLMAFGREGRDPARHRADLSIH